MITRESVSSKELFLVTPSEPASCSIHEFKEALEQKSDLSSLIDQTWSLIQDSTLSLNDTLKIWEIRLMLMLFNNKLNIAKKEAINLNNALYLCEDNNTSVASANKGLRPIYPLPKNNEELIEYNLLTLLIRLKSIPNLTLVNGLYKLTYQLRLKHNREYIYKKLMNLSYDVIVILIINKYYLTLLNLVGSIIHELEVYPERNRNNYYSNLMLIYIITQTLVTQNAEEMQQKHSRQFEKVNFETKESVYYVLSTVSPRLALPHETEAKAELPQSKDFSLLELSSIVLKGDISTRIICATMGVWDLVNRYSFQLSSVGEEFEFTKKEKISPENDIDACYNIVSENWSSNVHKVYGLE